jgi:transitional endoplasmic reticulum ATPase
MFNLKKPSFPNGWALEDGSRILKRLDKQQFVEVFALDSGEFFYLFHDPEVISKIKSRNLEYQALEIDGREVLSQKETSYIQGDINNKLNSITSRYGLDAIAGMKSLKALLMRDVISPFLNWESYEKYGVTPSNGILLFGPPGCGKTHIARKLAEAIRAEIIEISEGSIGSPYIHSTSINIAEAFKKAEQKAPCVLFIDEISGFLPRRDGIASWMQYKEAEINEFLIHMESCVQKKILLIGATNFPEKLDPAMLRSGRIDKKIFIPPPDSDARAELFKLSIEGRPCTDDIDYDVLSRASEGYMSSDIKLIVNNAALKALHNKASISMKILMGEIARLTPSLNAKELKRYLDFASYSRD